MGLYLCIFDEEEDDDRRRRCRSLQRLRVFRDAVRDRLEGGVAGSRFPILMNHPDSDGEWTPSEAKKLDVELSTIAKAHVKEEGLTPKTLLECFFEVSGEPLLEHLRDLCACSVERGLPIQFQ